MFPQAVLLGAILNLCGAAFYIRDTLRGVTQPNRVTWLLWSGAPLIAAAAGFADGVRWAVLPVFMAGFCPFLVLLASFANKKAVWNLSAFDWLCGGLSVLALVLWRVTKNPDIAIVFAIASDALALAPTLKKSWTHPESESDSAFIGGTLSALTGFFAVETWKFSEYGFSAYLVIANAALVLTLRRKK
jgi:hypothetical protein